MDRNILYSFASISMQRPMSARETSNRRQLMLRSIGMFSFQQQREQPLSTHKWFIDCFWWYISSWIRAKNPMHRTHTFDIRLMLIAVVASHSPRIIQIQSPTARWWAETTAPVSKSSRNAFFCIAYVCRCCLSSRLMRARVCDSV